MIGTLCETIYKIVQNKLIKEKVHIINTRELCHSQRKKKKSRGGDLWLQFAQILDCLCKVNKVLVN